MPFVAPCRIIRMSAPLHWLRSGWMDLTRAPILSLSYGIALTLLSLMITMFSWRFGTIALYIGLASGFMFIGPVLSVGLYSISRQLEEGRKPVLGYCIREGQHHIRELLVLGLILMVVLLLWARAATVMYVFIFIKHIKSIAIVIVYFISWRNIQEHIRQCSKSAACKNII